jgi:uncharacterized protein (TIGR00159 family)
MPFVTIFSSIRIQDVIDVLFLTLIAYYLYLWFRGTKALKALIGLLALGLVFTIARSWGLFLTTWVFQILWQVLIILLIILFQPEIRQVLERVNPFTRQSWRKFPIQGHWAETLADACFRMSRRRIGALIVVERDDRVNELLSGGVHVMGDPTPELLLSIFNKRAPLHDGAVIVRKGKVVSAANYLPLTTSDELPHHWGTRHRAAMGLSEKCDAWTIVVSEERGDVAMARNGVMGDIENADSLKETLIKDLDSTNADTGAGWFKRLRLMFTRRWAIKLGAFALVCAVWLAFAGQQDYEATFTVPLTVENLPANMQVIEPQKPSVTVTVRGLRKDASVLSHRNVQVKLDLTLASAGRRTFRISRYNIDLPIESVDILRFHPTEIKFNILEKQP